MALSRRALFISVLGLPVLAALPAVAATSAEDYVHQLGVEVLHLAAGGHRGDKALQRRFAGLLNRYINIPSVANFALGPAKGTLPNDEKGQFYELVGNYAAALFVWYVADFQGSDLKVTGSSEQGKFITVDSAVAGNGEQLKWRVSGSPGAYHIADLNVKGVWLSIAMKKMFEDTLNSSHGDFQPLFAKLREAETW